MLNTTTTGLFDEIDFYFWQNKYIFAHDKMGKNR
jgi:hypothetical protein